MRQNMAKSVDKSVFRNTAVNTKKINIEPRMYRGGIRL